MLTTPRPDPSTRIRSDRLSAGSPNRLAAPCVSRVSRPRWMVPTVAAETLPYSASMLFSFSATYFSAACRSFRSSSSRPSASATLKTMFEHALLNVVQLQHPRQQQGAHLRDRGPHG